MTDRDLQLETAISAACDELIMATTQDERHQIYQRMCQLCDQRTPEQIERMERVRGLV